MTASEAYEIAAQWHDKQSRMCRDVADDYLRVGPVQPSARRMRQATMRLARLVCGMRLSNLGALQAGNSYASASSNGRTPAFEAVNRGSSPRTETKSTET